MSIGFPAFILIIQFESDFGSLRWYGKDFPLKNNQTFKWSWPSKHPVFELFEAHFDDLERYNYKKTSKDYRVMYWFNDDHRANLHLVFIPRSDSFKVRVNKWARSAMDQGDFQRIDRFFADVITGHHPDRKGRRAL